MLRSVFSRRIRATVAALWLVGVGFAGFTAPLAWRRTGVVSAVPFILVVAALLWLAIAVVRAARWALIVSAVLLGVQIAGVAGSAWLLITGVTGAKARDLRRLGIDPVLGVELNLAFSATAFVVFAWIAARWRATGRARDNTKSEGK